MLKGPIAPSHVEDTSDANSEEEAPVSARKRDASRAAAATSHIELVNSIQVNLSKICLPLSNLIVKWFGPVAFQERCVVPSEYRNLLRQVSPDLFRVHVVLCVNPLW